MTETWPHPSIERIARVAARMIWLCDYCPWGDDDEDFPCPVCGG